MTWMVYAGGVLAVLLAALRAGRMLVEAINVAKFNQVMGKLLKEGNFDRARKLADAIPKALYGFIVRALVARTAELSADDGRSLVTDSLRETFAKAHAEQAKRMKRWDWLMVASALCAGVAALGPVDEVDTTVSIGLPVLAAFLLVGAWLRTRRELAVTKTGGEELVDLLATYVVDKKGK